jgi:hypothetical protein
VKILSGAETRPRIVNETIRKLQETALDLSANTYTKTEADALFALDTRNLTAGAGLTGGGTLEADRTFAVGAGTGITVNADDVAVATNQRTANLLFFISGGVAAITTGNKLGFRVPFACTITGVSLGLDQTGSIVIDIWKRAHASYPPTVSQTITASAKPTISSGLSYEDTTLTGWTTSITAGDWLFFNVDSITAAIICSINLTVLKT